MDVGFKYLEYKPELNNLIIGERGNSLKVYFSDGTTTRVVFEIWGSYDSKEDENEFEGKNLYDILKNYNFKRGTSTNLIANNGSSWATIAVNTFNFDNDKKNTDDSVSFMVEFDFDHSTCENKPLEFTDYQKSVFICELLKSIYNDCGLSY